MTSVAESLDSLSLGKARLAYDYINERISDGTFAPGHRLVLGSIASQIGVSTVPVREAVRMLEAEGVVTFERNVGAQVAGLDPALYSHAMESLAVIEGYATASAAPHLTSDDLSQARHTNGEMEDALHDADSVRFMELNARFHHLIFRRSPNPHLVDLVERTWRRLGQLQHARLGFVANRAPEYIAEHEHLIHLIESGASASVIEKTVREHHQTTLRSYFGL